MIDSVGVPDSTISSNCSARILHTIEKFGHHLINGVDNQILKFWSRTEELLLAHTVPTSFIFFSWVLSLLFCSM